ncbi:mechanosensitive ion channel family protein [Chitinilyticum piscinae]|uniref:Small-conductance mechanosensitive channel n=1 Tax=Chitinilyticum piscinae TaxID=2866724 RepID=A0A8J7FL99_9NEIS|nr:mechanosensitive ion channel family protein [Chitinilyticum piscinae]MBE9609870.1 mechanosensitive ion channel family protein [Chitinilyticum piscinae]
MKQTLTQIVFFFLLGCGLAQAATTDAGGANAAAASATASASEEAHAAKVFNRVVTTFRTGIGGYTAQDRANSAELRIQRLLAERPHGKFTSEPSELGIAIKLDGKLAFYLRDADVDTLANETLEQRTKDALAALEEIRQDQLALSDPKELARSIAISLLATLVFVLLLKGLSKARRWTLVRTRRYIARPIARSTGKYTGTNVRSLATMLRMVVNSIVTLIGLVGLHSWLSVVLYEIPYTRAWSEELNSALFGFLEHALMAMLNAIPNLLIACFILLVARYISRFIHFVFGRVERGELHLGMFDRDTASTTRRLLSFVVWLFAFAMIYPYLPGADTEAFKGLSVMVGLMVSLGASGIVGQFASGMIIIYSRALKVGEYVQIGEVEGTVVQIGLFATKIHTNLREEISIPNAGLVGQNVKNFSRLASGGGVITTISVTIGYDTPWRQVEAMLLEAAHATRGIRRTPRPVVYQTALSDWYVEYQLRIAVDEPRRKFEIINELNGKVQDTFNHYGVQIMSPHYIADPEQEKIVPEPLRAPAPAKPEA